MNMHIDQKVEVWQRISINDESKFDAIRKRLESGESVLSLYDEPEFEGCFDYEYMIDTEVELTPDDNDGQTTIELFLEEGKMVWNN